MLREQGGREAHHLLIALDEGLVPHPVAFLALGYLTGESNQHKVVGKPLQISGQRDLQHCLPCSSKLSLALEDAPCLSCCCPQLW